jgi:hypothetical protein
MIDNWSIWEPAWVGVDVNAFTYKDKDDKDQTAYRASLNICLEEGDINEEMKLVSVALNSYGDTPGEVAIDAYAKASAAFDFVVPVISLYTIDGASDGELNIEEFMKDAFKKPKHLATNDIEVFEED